MSDSREAEIRVQFLEEAQEYLNNIETVLLQLATQCTESQLDSAMRSAHSIKGGAAMMGFHALSELSHRYEDFFKVLWGNRKTLTIEPELETLLLNGLDCLRQVARLHRQGTIVDEAWINNNVNPIFEQLHLSLGDPQSSVPLVEDPEIDDQQDMVKLLFETEVEASLQRIEAVLANPDQPCLQEEVLIAAQELGGLGEMLELTAFTSLCESIIQTIESVSLPLEDAVKVALQAWRRSQALILIDQTALISPQLNLTINAPNDLADGSLADLSAPFERAELSHLDFDVADQVAIDEPLADMLTPEIDEVDYEEFTNPLVAGMGSTSQQLAQDATASPTELKPLEASANPVSMASWLSPPTDSFLDDFLSDALLMDDLPDTIADPSFLVQPALTPRAASLFSTTVDTATGVSQPLFSEPSASSEFSIVPTTQPKLSLVNQGQESSLQSRPASLQTPETTTISIEAQENTVRVAVKQLDQINDLFGELTIERNGLGLNLTRLRNLVHLLSTRMKALEQANSQLRTAYDTVATQSALSETLARSTQSAADGSVYGYNPSAIALNLLQLPHSYLGGRFDELEMDRYSNQHLLSQAIMETIVQVQEVASDIQLSLEETDQSARNLGRTTKQLQTNLTQLRMRPLADIVGRFPRALRELSLQYGKQVELKIYGGGTLIDRPVLEALHDPLMHLLRNCFDHGLELPEIRRANGKPEKGTIEIRAAYRGNRTFITISDDGAGINLDKIRVKAETMGLDQTLLANAETKELLELIFEPGFSTADRVTALSGRGVGMDVVRTNLRQVRGEIRVDTQPGLGTTFTISVPFTLSVFRVLLVESNGMMLAFPKDVIEEVLLFQEEQVIQSVGGALLNWEGYMVPLISLSQWLQFNSPFYNWDTEEIPTINQPTLLMISRDADLVGIRIDRCWGEQEVAIRQVEGSIPLPIGFAGCTILGNGRVVPLVDVMALLDMLAPDQMPLSPRSELPVTSSKPLLGTTKPPVDFSPTANYQRSTINTILIVDDSVNVRRFLALALEKAGYRVEQAKDGQDALEKLTGGLQVQAVICDIEMPRLDGYGFLARLKADPMFADLPVAMLTSRIGEKHRQLGMSLGAAAYFSKPYKEQELLQTLKQLIP